MIANKWKTIIEKRPYILGLLAALFVLFIYLPALDIYLIRDDFEWLNQSYEGWQNPSVLFELINNFFRPIVKLSYLLNYTFFKTQVPFYNLTTILFHLVNVFLLYIFIHRISKKKHIAVLTALTFGISPMYTEVTLWASGRPDSILLMFMMGVLLCFTKNNDTVTVKNPWTHQILIVLLTLCAVGSKETWVLLPFFVLSFLWVVKQVPLKTALKSTFSLFLLLVFYMGYFIGVPLLSGTPPPTSYADPNMGEVVKKFGFLIFKYVGLGDMFTASAWQYGLIIISLAGLIYWFTRDKNRLALWGMIWMFMSMGISLSIYYAPSRYNYFPLLGFWVMIISFLSREIERALKRFKIKPGVAFLVIGLVLLFHISYQTIMLQWEIKDYRDQGVPHKEVVDMYRVVKDQLPHSKPIVFVDISTRKAVHERAMSVKGYAKLLFVRESAIWQMVYLPPLANFMGEPFREMMVPIPGSELDAVFQGEYTMLVFTDAAFFISDLYKPKIEAYYRQNRKLPYKVQAVQFVPVKRESQTIGE